MVEAKPVTTLSQNVGRLLLGNTISKIFSLVAGVLTARYLGTEDYGVYSFAIFFSFIFAALADGGLQTILIREVSRDTRKASQYLGAVLILKSTMTLLAVLIMSGAVLLMDLSPVQVHCVYLSMAAFLAFSYANTAMTVFRAFERMVFEGLVTALQGLLFLLLVIAGTLMHADVPEFVGALLVSYVVSMLLASYLVITRFARPRFLLDAKLARFLIREALPVGASIFLFILYGRIGAVTLEALRGSTEVGTFGAALSLVQNLNFVPSAFTAAILPTLSQSAISNQDRFSRIYTTSFKAMLLLGLPLAVGGMILAETIVRIVYGPEFAEASATLGIIAWSVLFSFLSLVSRAALESINRQGLWTCALAIGVSANLVLNLLLIPHFGAVGASEALLLADVLIFLVASYLVLRALPGEGRNLSRLGLTALGSVTLMGLALMALDKQPLVLSIPAAGLIYLSSLILFRVIDSDDLDLLRRAFAAGRGRAHTSGKSDIDGADPGSSAVKPDTVSMDPGKR